MLKKKEDIFQRLDSFKGRLDNIDPFNVSDLKTFISGLYTYLLNINNEIKTFAETTLIDFVTIEIRKGLNEVKASIRQPEDGKDYVLTESDKKEIAKTISVPVVEKKVQTIIEKREVPIVVEKALHETAEQIAKKLNTKEESIDINTVKGLRALIEELKKAIRTKEKSSGGGGMGSVQHETKNVSSATTTITTDYKIAGNGYAIMGAYYQSALIMRGEHYTVGGDRKTLTLNFVPDDSTKIDIIYVRG